MQRRCGFTSEADVSGTSSCGGLCLAWKGSILVTLWTFSINHIDVTLKECVESDDWRFTRFCGSLFHNFRNDSWNIMRRLENVQDASWLVCGDFN